MSFTLYEAGPGPVDGTTLQQGTKWLEFPALQSRFPEAIPTFSGCRPEVRVRSFGFAFRFGYWERYATIVMTPTRQRGLYDMASMRRSVIARETARS